MRLILQIIVYLHLNKHKTDKVILYIAHGFINWFVLHMRSAYSKHGFLFINTTSAGGVWVHCACCASPLSPRLIIYVYLLCSIFLSPSSQPFVHERITSL